MCRSLMSLSTELDILHLSQIWSRGMNSNEHYEEDKEVKILYIELLSIIA